MPTNITAQKLSLARKPKGSGGVRYETVNAVENGKPWVVYIPQALLPATFPDHIVIEVNDA